MQNGTRGRASRASGSRRVQRRENEPRADGNVVIDGPPITPTGLADGLEVGSPLRPGVASLPGATTPIRPGDPGSPATPVSGVLGSNHVTPRKLLRQTASAPGCGEFW